jgi:hypothetical protein
LTAKEILFELHLLLGNAVLLPIPLGQKWPQQTSWQTITFADTQSQQYRDELHHAVRRGGNIGVLLGPASGRLLALDLDADSFIDEWITRHPWLADTLRTRGQRGCQFWMRLEADCEYPNSKAVFPLKENGKEIGELRLGGCGDRPTRFSLQGAPRPATPSAPSMQLIANISDFVKALTGRTPAAILQHLHALVGSCAVLLPPQLRQKGPQWIGWQTTTLERTRAPLYQRRLEQSRQL